MIAIDLATSYADARASAARTPLNSPARTYALEAAALKLARLQAHMSDVEVVLRHVDPANLPEDARAALRRIAA